MTKEVNVSDYNANLTAFEWGVLGAMSAIGTALGAMDPEKIGAMKDLIERIQAITPPGEPTSSDGAGIGHLPLKFLLSGIAEEKKP